MPPPLQASEYWSVVGPRLREGGLVLVNAPTFDLPLDDGRLRVFRIPATTMAADLGNALGGSMVMVGAYVAITGLVGLEATIEGMRQSIPPYRRQHIEANERVIRAGYEHAEALAVPAWEEAMSA